MTEMDFYHSGASSTRTPQTCPTCSNGAKPSTTWQSWPVIATVAATFPPMWSVPPSTYRDYNENISFGPQVCYLDKDYWEAQVCESRSAFVCFKASKALQGVAVIASRQIIPSSDVEGERHKRTYCPTTKGAEGFYAPGQYNDQLADAGTPAS